MLNKRLCVECDSYQEYDFIRNVFSSIGAYKPGEIDNENGFYLRYFDSHSERVDHIVSKDIDVTKLADIIISLSDQENIKEEFGKLVHAASENLYGQLVKTLDRDKDCNSQKIMHAYNAVLFLAKVSIITQSLEYDFIKRVAIEILYEVIKSQKV